MHVHGVANRTFFLTSHLKNRWLAFTMFMPNTSLKWADSFSLYVPVLPEHKWSGRKALGFTLSGKGRKEAEKKGFQQEVTWVTGLFLNLLTSFIFMPMFLFLHGLNKSMMVWCSHCGVTQKSFSCGIRRLNPHHAILRNGWGLSEVDYGSAFKNGIINSCNQLNN